MLGCISDNSVDDSYNRVASRLQEAKKDKQKIQNLMQKVYRLEAEREAEKKLFDDEFAELDRRFEAKLYQLNAAHAIELKQSEEGKSLEILQLHDTIENANNKIESLTNELNHIKSEFDKERKELMFSRENAADEQRQALLQRAIRAETKLREERLERRERNTDNKELSTFHSNSLLPIYTNTNTNINIKTDIDTNIINNERKSSSPSSSQLSVTIPRPSPLPQRKLHQQPHHFWGSSPSSSAISSIKSEHKTVELPSLLTSNYMNKSSLATITSMTTPNLNQKSRPPSAKSLMVVQSPHGGINRREIRKTMTTEIRSQLEMPECVTLPSSSISINTKEAKKLEPTSPQAIRHERLLFSQQAKSILLGSTNELSPAAQSHSTDEEYVIA